MEINWWFHMGLFFVAYPVALFIIGRPKHCEEEDLWIIFPTAIIVTVIFINLPLLGLDMTGVI